MKYHWVVIGLWVAGAMCVPALAENRVQNGGFEAPALKGEGETSDNPAGWTVFASDKNVEKFGLSSVIKHGGRQSLLVRAEAKPKVFQGIYQEIPVKPGKTYRFTLYVINSADNRMQGTVTGEMHIEWVNELGKEIDRKMGPVWNKSLSRSHWKKKTIADSAPTEASFGRFVISVLDGYKPGAGGSFYVDDASVE